MLSPTALTEYPNIFDDLTTSRRYSEQQGFMTCTEVFDLARTTTGIFKSKRFKDQSANVATKSGLEIGGPPSQDFLDGIPEGPQLEVSLVHKLLVLHILVNDSIYHQHQHVLATAKTQCMEGTIFTNLLVLSKASCFSLCIFKFVREPHSCDQDGREQQKGKHSEFGGLVSC